MLLLFLAIQQIENTVLAPRISGHAVGLHPLGAMFALLAGFQLAGLLGGLFAVPLAAVCFGCCSAPPIAASSASRNPGVDAFPFRNFDELRGAQHRRPDIPYVPSAEPPAVHVESIRCQSVRRLARMPGDESDARLPQFL